jgi:hypothetical protein
MTQDPRDNFMIEPWASADKVTEERNPRDRRIGSARRRQLPGFIIIGAQRGGTTSLYNYLTDHPQVGAATRKEVHFFDRYFEKGIDWYRAHFPKRGEFAIVGEASPYYLFHPEAPQRICTAMPGAKCIALLRNPIDRAYSHYHFKVAKGLETLPFAEAVEREPERLEASDDPMGPAWRHHSYLARGAYADQIRRWLTVFPSEQLLILQSEEFYREPQRILHLTQDFLGVDRHEPRQFTIFHDANYPAMDPDVRRRLTDHFAPLNRELYALLGRDFGWEEASY